MKKLKILSKIFLDSGDPEETQEAEKLLGFLDGQTTNPTLISQNPEVKKRIEKGEKFTKEEIYQFYKEVVKKIAKTTDGPISIEVYANKDTKAQTMFTEAEEMAKWVSNACIKLPITEEGLKAAQLVIRKDIPLNMTLCFSQEQAAAVYSATKDSKKSIFVSPFVGRLDDRGENGMDLIKNILEMFERGDGHVLTLSASTRNIDHFLYALWLSCPIITVPFKVIKEWAEKKFVIPNKNFIYQRKYPKPIPYQEILLDKNWSEYNIHHDLTDAGVEKFSADWEKLFK
jgi:transaldolase